MTINMRWPLECILLLALFNANLESQDLQGPPEARSLYRRMSDSFRNAKTVQLQCSAHFKTVDFEADVTASLLMHEGNKMRLEVDIKGTKDHEPYSSSMRMVSNGSLIRTRQNQDAWSTYATTAHWNETLLINIIRGGFPTGLELDHIKSKEGGAKDNVGIAFIPIPEPVDFVLWKTEEIQGRKVIPIEFKVKSAAEYIKDNSVILWLDAGTGLPTKRMNVIQTSRTLSVTEAYQSVLLDGTIDDSHFSLPQE